MKIPTLLDEESYFLTTVGNICSRFIVTCSSDEPLSVVARRMNDMGTSGIFIVDACSPTGIITDRDFVSKVAATDQFFDRLKARDIMSTPVLTVAEYAPVFEAMYLMAKHNIHRLGVIDGQGCLVGSITDTDVIRGHVNSPLYLIRDMEKARDAESLRELHDKVNNVVVSQVRSGARIREIVRMTSFLNDALMRRAVSLVRLRYPDLPEFSFLVLGSEGRMEQTLKTDQDNAIVFDDGIDATGREMLARFSDELIEMLITIGMPRCPGGIMANSELWRRSESEWSDCLTAWIASPVPDNILNYSMFSDQRTITGDLSYERRLKQRVARLAGENRIFLAHMAKNIMRFPVPLGFMGTIKTDKAGECTGKIDVKKAALFALTEGIKLLALDMGITDGGTLEKLAKVGDSGIMTRDELLDIETAFSFLLQLRLKYQAREFEEGRQPTNCVDPDELNRIEYSRLKISLEVTDSFLKILKNRYRLDFVY